MTTSTSTAGPQTPPTAAPPAINQPTAMPPAKRMAAAMTTIWMEADMWGWMARMPIITTSTRP